MKKKKKRLFIENLEQRKSTSPLMVNTMAAAESGAIAIDGKDKAGISPEKAAARASASGGAGTLPSGSLMESDALSRRILKYGPGPEPPKPEPIVVKYGPGPEPPKPEPIVLKYGPGPEPPKPEPLKPKPPPVKYAPPDLLNQESGRVPKEPVKPPPGLLKYAPPDLLKQESGRVPKDPFVEPMPGVLKYAVRIPIEPKPGVYKYAVQRPPEPTPGVPREPMPVAKYAVRIPIEPKPNPKEPIVRLLYSVPNIPIGRPRPEPIIRPLYAVPRIPIGIKLRPRPFRPGWLKNWLKKVIKLWSRFRWRSRRVTPIPGTEPRLLYAPPEVILQEK